MSIEQIGLFIGVLGLILATIPIYTARKNDSFKKVVDLKSNLLSNDWCNEGDIRPLTDTHIFLRLFNQPGFNKISGTLKLGNIEREFDIYGIIKANGVIYATLNTTIGWRGFPVCKIKFKYNYGDDQLTFIPLRRLKKINDDEVYEQYPFDMYLKEKITMWRSPKFEDA